MVYVLIAVNKPQFFSKTMSIEHLVNQRKMIFWAKD